VAHGATRHIVDGAGWGHGAGMSQYGAYGLAQHGRTYRQILAHYYRGTDLGQAQTRTIRVLLTTGRGTVAFSGAARASRRRLDPAKSYRARLRGSRVELRTSRGKLVTRFSAPLRVRAPRGGGVRLAGTAIGGKANGAYRGSLELSASPGGGLTVVNAVALDQYVQGVVPKESPASWPAEALKAQAVAARSYALATDRGGPVFDQYPDVRSQVYRGMDEEAATTNAATQATAGEILRYDGEVATTFFFSTSGGHTENVENVFYGEPKPYLRGVEDPYDDASPRHRWRFTFSQSRMDAALGGWVKGSFREIDVVRRGVSPRIVSADVVGTDGRTRVTGADLRARLGLYDTWARFTRVDTDADPASTGTSPAAVAQALLETPTRRVHGSITPAPRSRKITVELRDGRRWRAVRTARTSRRGAYSVEVEAAGTYRVRTGSITGPRVRVR
jgi:stage II sporulation protein D